MASHAAAQAAADGGAQTSGIESRQRIPLVVIGAGPHALSLVSKLLEESVDPLEETPENTYLFRVTQAVQDHAPGQATESHIHASAMNPASGSVQAREHHGVAGHSASGSSVNPLLLRPPPFKVTSRHGILSDKISASQSDRVIRGHIEKTRRSKSKRKRLLKDDIVVLDRNGAWMSQWDEQFKVLGIPNLRSGMTAHPCPVDTQTFFLHTRESNQFDTEVVPVDLERTPDYHGPFHVPRTALFREFVQKVIDRYNCGPDSGVVRQATVTAVVPVQPTSDTVSKASKESGAPEGDAPIGNRGTYFRVYTAGAHEPLEADAVVVAAGPLNIPNYPAFWKNLSDQDIELSRDAGSLAHATDLMHAHYSKTKKSAAFQPIRRLLIVGGGLTAGHLAVRGLKETIAEAPDGKVTMVARGSVRERQFDLDLPWMGRCRTQMLCERFWGHNAVERLAILRHAKNGGSITPEVLHVLEEFEEQGRFETLEDTEVESIVWQQRSAGEDDYEKSIATRDGNWLVTYSDGVMEVYDAIWCATGTILDARKDPLLRDTVAFADAREDLPDALLLNNRLPVLDEECRLVPGLDLFVMGQYAGIQLGPGAVNLMGGRAGAARVARALARRTRRIGICAYPKASDASKSGTSRSAAKGRKRKGRRKKR